MEEVSYFVGVAQLHDVEGGVVPFAVKGLVVGEELGEDVGAENAGCGAREEVVVLAGECGECGVAAHEHGSENGVDGVVDFAVGAVAAAAVALSYGDAVVVVVVGMVVDVEVDDAETEGGRGVEDEGCGDVGFAGDVGAGGDGVVVGNDAYGEVVVFLEGIVEEVVATVGVGRADGVAVDVDGHVDVVDGVVVAGVEEEVAIGEVDEELFVG